MINAMTHPCVITIVGPTASGKTGFGVELAKRIDGEIISADSRQIYRGMDIGTAKATLYERGGIPHHLIDIREPDEEYSVAEFQSDAERAVRDILARGKRPIMVGGSGMYVSAVVEHWDIPALPPNKQFRARHANTPTEELFEMLTRREPDVASAIDPANRHRVLRALEKTMFGINFYGTKRRSPYAFLQFGITVDRDVLYERIDRRVDAMVAAGLQEEVARLGAKFGFDAPGLNTIGYREMGMALRDECTFDKTIELIKRNSRRYAKRQMTWFRRDRTIRWVSTFEELWDVLESNC